MIWQLTKNKDWASLERQFSWVAEMKYVEQHKIHHAEGNVAIHTQMVLNELLKLSSFQNLDEQDKEILWAAALMHDIEKRSSSVIKRWPFNKGFWLARKSSSSRVIRSMVLKKYETLASDSVIFFIIMINSFRYFREVLNL